MWPSSASVGWICSNTEHGVDPAYQMWERVKTAEATRLWSHFFCNNSPSNFSLQISACWANFFTIMVLSPINYNWAKEFIHSNALSLLDDDSGSIEFSVSPKCPANGHPLCVTETTLDRTAEKEGQADAEIEKVVAKTAKATQRKEVVPHPYLKRR